MLDQKLSLKFKKITHNTGSFGLLSTLVVVAGALEVPLGSLTGLVDLVRVWLPGEYFSLFVGLRFLRPGARYFIRASSRSLATRLFPRRGLAGTLVLLSLQKATCLSYDLTPKRRWQVGHWPFSFGRVGTPWVWTWSDRVVGRCCW